MKKALKILEDHASNPKQGLPDDLFLFISRKTPMINVDLLIKDEKGRFLLAWRKDKYSKAGWHVPGGIIRYKEKIEKRIKEVARLEIGAPVKFDKKPVAINQLILNQKERAHFISLLYNCFLGNDFKPQNKGLKPGDAGFLKWHSKPPANLIKVHDIYRKYMTQGN